MTEGQLQQAVIECAQLFGWRVAHFRPARVMRGGREVYETPVAADGKGFPDLVLARDGRVIFAELKGSTGRLRPEQEMWLQALHGGQVETRVWRPADWLAGTIEAALRSEAAAA